MNFLGKKPKTREKNGHEFYTATVNIKKKSQYKIKRVNC